MDPVAPDLAQWGGAVVGIILATGISLQKLFAVLKPPPITQLELEVARLSELVRKLGMAVARLEERTRRNPGEDS